VVATTSLRLALPALSRRAGLALLLPAALLVAWELATRAHLANPLFLPPLAAVAATGRRLLASGDLLVGLRASLLRAGAGLAAGAAVGVSAGVALGVSRVAGRAFHTTLAALKQISPFAFIPLLSFWLGLGEPAKVAFIALTCVFPIFVNTYEGVRSVPPRLIEVGRAHRLGRWALVTRIVLPAAAPSIFAGLHLGVFFSWLGTVGAEYFFLAGPGLGNIILDGRAGFRMELVFFGVAAIGATGVALNGLISLAEHRVLRWRPGGR
jgi:sulfonate transport system permease protein